MSGKYVYMYIYVYRYIYIYLNLPKFTIYVGKLDHQMILWESYGKEFGGSSSESRLRWKFGCLPTTKEGKASRFFFWVEKEGMKDTKNPRRFFWGREFHIYIYTYMYDIYIYIFINTYIYIHGGRTSVWLRQESFLFSMQVGELFKHIWKVNRVILANSGLQLRKLLEDIFTSSLWGRFPNLAKPSLQLARLINESTGSNKLLGDRLGHAKTLRYSGYSLVN